MPPKADAPSSNNISRWIDPRIPLPWLIGGIGSLMWTLVNMWFSLQQIQNDVAGMKAAVVQATATAGRVQLLEYRVTKNEADIAELKGRK